MDAREKFNELLKALTPFLKSYGYSRRGQNFHTRSGDNWGMLFFQKGKGNSKTHLEFTVNLGVFSQAIDSFFQDWVKDKLMNKFVFGGANKAGVYFDEENRRHLNSIRLAYAQSAMNFADNGRQQEARQMLNKADKMMLEENYPYGMPSRSQQHNQIALQFAFAAYRAGDSVLAAKVTKSLKKDMEQQKAYYESLDENKRYGLSIEEERNDNLLRALMSLEQEYKDKPLINAETPGSIQNIPRAADTPKR